MHNAFSSFIPGHGNNTKISNECMYVPLRHISGIPRNFVRGGGGSTNSVEDRENGDLGAVAP